MYRARVLLADDHPLVLESIRALLEEHCEIVGTAEDGRSLLESARTLNPDIIVLDVSMPLLNGIEAARILRREFPRIKLVFVTMHADPAYIAEALRAGGSAYLLKRSAASELLDAIRTVLRGRLYVTPLVQSDVCRLDVHKKASPARSDPLTVRQREVLALIGEGKTTKEIASLLSISVKTVEFHKTNLMAALDLHTTAELTRYAIRHGLVNL